MCNFLQWSPRRRCQFRVDVTASGINNKRAVMPAVIYVLSEKSSSQAEILNSASSVKYAVKWTQAYTNVHKPTVRRSVTIFGRLKIRATVEIDNVISSNRIVHVPKRLTIASAGSAPKTLPGDRISTATSQPANINGMAQPANTSDFNNSGANSCPHTDQPPHRNRCTCGLRFFDCH